jgi:hypothetical protein
MTEPWQIHVCPVHGPRTPTMLGDCPVGCCAEVMEVVPVVRDTREDRMERYRALQDYLLTFAETIRDTLGSDDETAGDWSDALKSVATEVDALRQQHAGAVEDCRKLREALTVIRDALEPDDPIFTIAAGALAFTTDRGQPTAEEAFEQSSGGETLEEAQARQLRGEHAFSPQPDTRGATDEPQAQKED